MNKLHFLLTNLPLKKFFQKRCAGKIDIAQLNDRINWVFTLLLSTKQGTAPSYSKIRTPKNKKKSRLS